MKPIILVAAAILMLPIVACASSEGPAESEGLREYSHRVSASEAEATVQKLDDPTATGCYRRACSIDRCYEDGTCDVTLSIPGCMPGCPSGCANSTLQFCEDMGCGL